MNYVNRCDELNFIFNTITNRDSNIIFVEFDKSSGISEFLIESSKTFGNDYVFLLDLTEGTDLVSLLMRSVVKDPQKRKNIQSIADNKIGVKNSKLSNSLVKLIPYVGDAASEILYPKNALPVYSGDYSSLYDELLLPFLDVLRKTQKVIIYLDSAEKMNSASQRFIQHILENHYNVFVIAAIEYDHLNSIKLKNKLSSIQLPCTLRFLQPDVKMIQLLANHYGLNCTEKMATEIQYKAATNIHRIIEIIRNYKNTKTFVFEKMHIAIINFLSILPFGLTEFEIKLFLDSTELIFQNKEVTFALKTLSDNNYIKAYENKFKIIAHTHPNVIQILENVVDVFYYESKTLSLICANLLYKKFDYLSIAYNIAHKSNDTKKQKLAQELIVYSISVCQRLDDAVVIDANLNKLKTNDCLIGTLYFMQLREFETAIKYAECIKQHQVMQPLYAVLLNRCRKHNKAENELKKSILNIANPNERAIIYAYLISNYVHSNKISKAKEVFSVIDNDVRESTNYSYVLRNYATIFEPSKALTLSMDARELFLQTNDCFGLYSTEANINRFLCETGEVQTALNRLLEIYKHMKDYKEVHTNIVLNNIGICHLLLDDPYEAIKYFECSKKSQFSVLLSGINQASALLKINKSDALQRMNDLINEVIKIPIDRVRQRFFINYVHILYANDLDISESLETVLKYKDRVTPDKTVSLYNIYRTKVSNNIKYDASEFNMLYCPCFLEYWYAEPLKLLSLNTYEEVFVTL